MTNPSNKTLALNLLRGAVPERAHEFSNLWDQYNHDVEVISDSKNVTMNATSKRIQFSTKTIDIFWLYGFSFWHAIEVYSPALLMTTAFHIPLEQGLNCDEERGQYEFDFMQRLNVAHSLISAENTSAITWPTDIPKPTSDRDGLGKDQHKAAFDLVALAFSFALLHEFEHVKYRVDNSAPPASPEEELACDVNARAYMTRTLAEYARDHGHSFEEVSQKRAMGIALGAVIIHCITPAGAHFGNDEYPPLPERMCAMIKDYSLSSDSSFWTVAACFLIALMRQQNRPLDIVANSNQEIVNILLERLS
ncbi:MAG: phage exclusion protein Lit family protein [Thalassospira sp.]|uniref:phage exclusion protein Lit family protein n=1 Tax=Thalassospira sp. TaxID=1912094 RepID=UPI0032ECBF2D